MCAILENLKGKSTGTIFSECNLKDNIPIELDIILDKYGIKRGLDTFEPLESILKLKMGIVAGAIFVNDNSILIFHKTTDSIAQKRFTIAHEIGHFCLHGEMLKDSHNNCFVEEYKNFTTSSERIEQEANASKL